MAVYSVGCTFPNPDTPVVDATNGWDVVYAIKYSAINQALNTHRPWETINDNGGPGTFFKNTPYGEFSGRITGLFVMRGSAGREVRFELEIDSADIFDVTSKPVGNLRATIKTKPIFAKGAQAGLVNLTVAIPPEDPSAPATQPPEYLEIVDVNFNPGSTGLDMYDMIDFLENLLSADPYRGLFSIDLAAIYSADYAESVNIPWLQPTAFDYATADLPDGVDGILGVLGSISGDRTGLSASINVQAIPIEDNINAVVIINSNILSINTFCEQLNSQLGASTIGSLSYSQNSGTISNDKDIVAYYHQEDTGGFVLLHADAVADASSGVNYPTKIPAGALRFSVRENSIEVTISPALITMGEHTIILQSSSSFQIMVDGDGNFDIMLVGEPKITYDVNSPKPKGTDVLLNIGAVGIGIVAGEFIPFVFDAAFKGLTNIGMTRKAQNQYALDFLAADKYVRANNQAAEFSIGLDRAVVVTPGTEIEGNVFKITQTEREAVRLKPTNPFIYARTENLATDNSAVSTMSLGGYQQYDQRQRRLLTNIPGVREQLPSSNNLAIRETRPLKPVVNMEMVPLNAPARTKQASTANLLDVLIDNARLPNQKDFLRRKIGTYTHNNVINLIQEALSVKSYERRGRIDENIGSLTEPQLDNLYKGLVEYVEAGYREDIISSAAYTNIVARCEELLGGERSDGRGRVAPSLFLRIGKKIVEVPPGLLAEFYASRAERRGQPPLEIVKTIIVHAPRSMTVKVTAIALYVAGLAASYFLADKLQGLVPTAENKAREKVQDFADSTGPTKGNLLFKTVSFPLMTRFADDPAYPTPDVVLKCAAVNGGLVLGASIRFSS